MSFLPLQLSIKQELKLSETPVQIKKDKKGVKDITVCPKKKKRKQRSPAKVHAVFLSQRSYFFHLHVSQINQILVYVFVCFAVVDSQHQ